MEDFIESLKVENQIGTGGFSKVLLATGDDGRKYTLKRINSSSDKTNIKREIKAGKMLSHKNVSQFVCHFNDDKNEFLVFDYVEGYDIFTLLDKRDYKPFSETEAHHIFDQILRALDYCHQRGVINLDVKLDNIIVDPVTLRATLIDFGLCDFITPENKGYFTRKAGSDEYAPIEILQKNRDAYEGSKVDIWCLGVVLYCMLSSTFPFEVEARKVAVREDKPHPELSIDFPISKEARDLITKMLEFDPTKRITIEEIYEHPWFTSQ